MAITKIKRLRHDFLNSIGGGFIPNQDLKLPDGSMKQYAGYHIDLINRIATVTVYQGDSNYSCVREMPDHVSIKGNEYRIHYHEGVKPTYITRESEPNVLKKKVKTPNTSMEVEEIELETSIKGGKLGYTRRHGSIFPKFSRPAYGR